MRTNLTIFVLFFGVALLEAIRNTNWTWIFFWLVMGSFFLWADRKESSRSKASARQSTAGSRP